MTSSCRRIHRSSFRDPSGFLFETNDILYRQVNNSYKLHYDYLIDSGLYEELVALKMMVPHKEVDTAFAVSNSAYKVLRPQVVKFISYPYEWCLSELKHAALAMLDIQKIAFKYGMCLKDASAYNVQFVDGQPILIDTLSFEIYEEGSPWVAYRQFCQHFLATLALMCHVDVRLGQLLRVHLDGIPLDMASGLLPLRTYLQFGILSHIHLHARSQTFFSDKPISTANKTVSRVALQGIIDSLYVAVKRLKWRQGNTDWFDYYSDTKHNYSSEATSHKKTIVQDYIENISPTLVWDLGANDGTYSRLATSQGIPTVAFDSDPTAVEINYLDSVSKGDIHMMPLLLDLTNPSADIGWSNEERLSLSRRAPADLVMALALVHHLVISNNVPFVRLAEWFSLIGKTLIVEFVPKSDSQVARLLSYRKDVFDDYNRTAFERAFEKLFVIMKVSNINDSNRLLYLMQNRSDLK